MIKRATALRAKGEDVMGAGGRHCEVNETSAVCEIEDNRRSLSGRARCGERQKCYPNQQKPFHPSLRSNWRCVFTNQQGQSVATRRPNVYGVKLSTRCVASVFIYSAVAVVRSPAPRGARGRL